MLGNCAEFPSARSARDVRSVQGWIGRPRKRFAEHVFFMAVRDDRTPGLHRARAGLIGPGLPLRAQIMIRPGLLHPPPLVGLRGLERGPRAASAGCSSTTATGTPACGGQAAVLQLRGANPCWSRALPLQKRQILGRGVFVAGAPSLPRTRVEADADALAHSAISHQTSWGRAAAGRAIVRRPMGAAARSESESEVRFDVAHRSKHPRPIRGYNGAAGVLDDRRSKHALGSDQFRSPDLLLPSHRSANPPSGNQRIRRRRLNPRAIKDGGRPIAGELRRIARARSGASKDGRPPICGGLLHGGADGGRVPASHRSRGGLCHCHRRSPCRRRTSSAGWLAAAWLRIRALVRRLTIIGRLSCSVRSRMSGPSSLFRIA